MESSSSEEQHLLQSVPFLSSFCTCANQPFGICLVFFNFNHVYFQNKVISSIDKANISNLHTNNISK